MNQVNVWDCISLGIGCGYYRGANDNLSERGQRALAEACKLITLILGGNHD